ncbi:unnamed protein product [Psylliodes chrysocephalus]|uniref:CCHC-type domain-containing protein n=1 Tax=Psylliodes chrysocephalus TaxID=3402493 RepID=A0A9P0CZG4_9CUCU|nr:unnamed protein product [Psylliodes chrysocephala]
MSDNGVGTEEDPLLVPEDEVFKGARSLTRTPPGLKKIATECDPEKFYSPVGKISISSGSSGTRSGYSSATPTPEWEGEAFQGPLYKLTYGNSSDSDGLNDTITARKHRSTKRPRKEGSSSEEDVKGTEEGRDRSNSLPISITQPTGNKKKGKLEENKKPDSYDVHVNTIKQLQEKVEELQRLVTENPNTKKEIKHICKQLFRISKSANDQVKNIKPEKEVVTFDMGTQTNVTESQTRDMATQASENRMVTKEDVDREGAEGTWDSTKMLCEEEWAKEAYLTKIIGGNPASLPGDADVVVLFDPEEGTGDMNIAGQQIIKEVIELRKIKKGGVAKLQNKRELIMDGQVMTKTEGRAVFLAGISDQEESNYALLKIVKEKIEGGEGRAPKIKIIAEPKIVNVKLRKMVECTLRGVAEEISLYDMETQLMEEGEEWAAITKKRKQKAPAIMIRQKDKSYEDILRDLKSKISRERVPEGIKMIRKTRAGDLIVEMDDEEGIKSLREEINKNISEATVKILKRNKVVINIYDVDAVTSAEEIARAVGAYTGAEAVEVRSLRPMEGGRQAATVELDEEEANKLFKEKEVRIGWTRCRVKERVDVGRCYRCGSINHIARDCKEPPMGEKCRKCGDEGHKAADCKEEKLYCWTCKTDGHRNASFKCPVFRNAVKKGERKK